MLSELGSLLGLVRNAAGTIGEASGAAEKLKKIISTPKSDTLEALELIVELRRKLLDAKIAQMDVEKRVLELEKQLQRQDQFQAKLARYTLTQTDMGGRVYVLKADDPSDNCPHEICVSCVENEKISILQPATDGPNTLVCNQCSGRVFKNDGRSGAMIGSVPSRRDDWSDY
tara:strand:+ start:34572 stop:35087 length:516 start_codon:yes stop_codon:yes gene_type:complete